MNSCPICPRTAPDGQHLCLLHSGELRGWLAELPRQARLLEAFLVPSASPAAGRTGGTGRATAPIPVDLRVLVLLGPGHADPPTGLHADEDGDDTVPILTLLDGWAGYIAYTYPAVTTTRDGTTYIRPCEQAWASHGATVTGWCAWLTAYLPYALTHPWIADLHRQLGDLLARILDLTHTTPHRHPQAAPCPHCQAFRLAAVDGQPGITCQACGHYLERTEYDQHAADFLHNLQTEQAGQPATWNDDAAA